MKGKATNEYVFIIRDEINKQKDGLIIPGNGRVKPHSGTVMSVGSLVRDQEIKRAKGGKVLFHPQVGFEIEFEGVTYLVCQGYEIIYIV